MIGNDPIDYSVDMVFVVDATSGMRPLLKALKKLSQNFCGDFMRIMNAKGRTIKNLRIRVITFRDYKYDKEKAMMVTDFFDLPSQAEDFRACISSI